MQRIDKADMDLALKIFSWIFRAQRVLTMDELLEALVVEEGDECLERGGLLDPAEVVECCKSLVLYEESSGLVRFTHETAQDFIANNVQQSLLSTINLAKTCLTYLSFTELMMPSLSETDFQERIRNHRFSHYAGRYWDYHAREVEEDEEIQAFVIKLLASESRRNSLAQLELYSNSNWLGTSFTTGQKVLHVAAEKGLVAICRVELNSSNLHATGSFLSAFNLTA
jgi:hypothetical protein